jgi:hypothetical protein
LTTTVSLPVPSSVVAGTAYRVRLLSPWGGDVADNGTNIVITTNCTGTEYDGINDVSTIPASTVYSLGTNSFTLEAWVKMSSTQSNAQPVIISRGSIAGADGFALFSQDLGTTLRFRFGSFGITTPVFTSIWDNQCHHVAMTRNGTVINFYLDGVLIWNTSIVATKGISASSAMTFGNDLVNGNPFRGQIHEVRFWDIDKTQSDINAAKTSILSPTTANLKGYWRMKDVNSQTLTDGVSTPNNGVLGATAAVESTDPSRTAISCYSNDRIEEETFQETLIVSPVYESEIGVRSRRTNSA